MYVVLIVTEWLVGLIIETWISLSIRLLRQLAATSLQQHITPCVQVGRVQFVVVATRHGDTLQGHVAGTNHFVCTREFLWKSLSVQWNVVAVTSHTNSVWFDFLRHVAATKFCWGDKDFHKILQYAQTDLSLRWVPTTCCYNLSPSVYRPLVIIKSFKSNPHYLLVSLSQSPC